MPKNAFVSKSDAVHITYTTVIAAGQDRPKSRLCQNGHVVTPDTTIIVKNGRGMPQSTCKQCRLNARERYEARHPGRER